MQPKPPHSFLFGHLKLFGEAFAMLPSYGHYQVAVTTIARKYNMPGVFYLDLWPIADGQMVVTDHDVALHVTAHRNHPKHRMEGVTMDPMLGAGNIVSVDGPRWKHLHRMLSPAFSISHTTAMRPAVADEVLKFRSILHEKAQSGETFRLEDFTQHLTFDVIGTATFGRSLNAQADGSPALQHFHNMCRAHRTTRESFNLVRNFFVNARRDSERRKLDANIAELIKERFEIVKRKCNLGPRHLHLFRFA